MKMFRFLKILIVHAIAFGNRKNKLFTKNMRCHIVDLKCKPALSILNNLVGQYRIITKITISSNLNFKIINTACKSSVRIHVIWLGLLQKKPYGPTVAVLKALFSTELSNKFNNNFWLNMTWQFSEQCAVLVAFKSYKNNSNNIWGAVKWKRNTRHKRDFSQYLATLVY